MLVTKPDLDDRTFHYLLYLGGVISTAVAYQVGSALGVDITGWVQKLFRRKNK